MQIATAQNGNSMKIASVIRKDLDAIHGKLLLARLLLAPFPHYTGSRLRSLVLASGGFQVGRGTEFWGMPTITGAGNVYQRLTIGLECWFNIRVLLNLGAPITIGDSVAIRVSKRSGSWRARKRCSRALI